MEDVCKSLCHYCKLKAFAANADNSFVDEKKKLSEGIDILISTPERLETLKYRKFLFMSNLSFFIVDEADTFLDSGYQELISAYI